MMVIAWLNFAAVTTLLAFWFYKTSTSATKRFLIPALAVKLGSGVAVGVVYLYFFQYGDTFRFFRDAVVLAESIATSPQEYLAFLWRGDESFALWSHINNTEPRSLFFVKLLSLICLVGGADYWLCAGWLSLVAFVSMWLLVQRLSELYPTYTLAFAIAFLFWPTEVFWSSGVLKESVALAALIWLVRLAIEFAHTRRVTLLFFVQVGFCCWISWSLKYYWIGLLAPALLLVAGHRYKNFWRIGVAAMVLLALVLVLHPNFYPSRILQVITENYYQFHYLTGGNNTFHFFQLQPTWSSMLVNSPWALFSGLFRPFLWESTTFFHVLASLENLLLLLLTLHTLRYFQLAPPLRGWIIPLFVYALVECTFLTLSTPSWGTLIRYRVGLLPFFVVFCLVANTRWQQFFQRQAN